MTLYPQNLLNLSISSVFYVNNYYLQIKTICNLIFKFLLGNKMFLRDKITNNVNTIMRNQAHIISRLCVECETEIFLYPY